MTPADAHAARLQRLRKDWQPIPDKPEETPENTLLALGWAAALSYELEVSGRSSMSADELRLALTAS